MLYLELRGLMKSNDYTQAQLGRKLGMTRESLSGRMRGKIAFKQKEMYTVMNLFNVPYDRLAIVFPPDGKRVQPKDSYSVLG